MKPIDLNAIPYKHRFNGASLLIAKANKLSGMSSGDGETRDEKALTTALAYYDMALSLQKPYDPNYPTALNWKCNVLIKLGRYADAVAWYREIIRISDETNGKHLRDAYAELAEKMIQAYAGRPDESLQEKPGDDGTTFDEPPYCMYAEAFCELLVAQKFKKAHDCLSPSFKKDFSLEKLRGDWHEMSQGAGVHDVEILLQNRMTDWPARKADEIGWCYFSISTESVNEAIAIVVGRTPQHAHWITGLEFGRP